MATYNISANTYYDALTAQTGGDVMNMLNRDATLTVRTDSRVHQNAPSGMKGSFGSQVLTEGKILIDGRNIREVWFDIGSGTVPAIGTTISQGAVSGFMLGVWANLSSAPVTVGGAMPTTGFIKFREITGGNFSAGALTGINANATGEDRPSWMEVVGIENSTITTPRLGTYEVKGNPERYLVGETNGTVGQQFQMPTNGGGDSFVSNLYIEDGLGGFDRYSSLLNTNGWQYQYLGQPASMVDDRHYFSKYVSGGKLQLGETISQTGLAYTMPVLNTTYTIYNLTNSAYYTWKDNILEIHYHDLAGYFGFKVGNYYYLDSMVGDLPDGLYQLAEIVDYNTYRFTAPGSGNGGYISTTRVGWRITATAHGLDTNDKIYATFTSGSMNGVTGEFDCIYYDANSVIIMPPAGIGGASVTNGNVTVQWYAEVTQTAHGRQMGHLMDFVFNTGLTGKDGTYPIFTPPVANSYRINVHNNNTATSGTLTTTQQLGFVPPAGRKVYINNVLLRSTLNATTNTNTISSTLGTRPEFDTLGGGKIYMEYTDCNWYFPITQAYEAIMEDNSIADVMYFAELSTPLKCNRNVVGSWIPVATSVTNFTSLFNTAGGEVLNNKIIKANATTANQAMGNFSYNDDLEVAYNEFGHLTSLVGAGYGYYSLFGNRNNFHDNKGIQAIQLAGTVTEGFFKDFTYIDKFIGYSNNYTSYANNIQSSTNFIVDGFSIGNYTNVKPITPNYTLNNKDVVFKNFGTQASPIDFGSDWKPVITSLSNILASGSYSGNVYLRDIYVKNRNRVTGITSITNADKNVVLRNVVVNGFGMYNVLDGFNQEASSLRLGAGVVFLRSQTLGSHFQSYFLSDTTGYYQVVMNEPSVETSSQYNVIAGTPSFAGNGYLYMKTLGDEMTLEDTIYRKGFTGGRLMMPYFYGYDQTSGRINFWYQLDKGNGWEAEQNLFFRATGVATAGQYTTTFSDLDGGEIKVGNYCILYAGTHRILRKVVDVTGNVVTFDEPNGYNSGGSYHFFFNMPNEVIDPVQGVKIKIRAKTRITNSTSVWANIFIPMTTTAPAQQEKYPTGTVTIEGANPTDIIKAYIYDVSDSNPAHNTYIGEGIGEGEFDIVTTPYLGSKFYVVRYDSQGTAIVNTRNFAKDILETDNGIIKVYGGDEVQIAQSETIELINSKVDLIQTDIDSIQTECNEVKIYAKDASHNTQQE